MTEEPLNFEREPEGIVQEQEPLFSDLHTSVTRMQWQTHGMMQSVKDAAHAALEAVTRFTQRMSSVGGPVDYPVDYHERLDRVERTLERQRYAAPPRNGDGDESNWKTIALLALGALQTGTLFVLGFAWSSMDKLKDAQTATHDDVIQIKCKLDPQCRIVVTSDSTSRH